VTPSRIGTATLAVFVTAHGPAPEGEGGAAAHPAPAVITAAAAAVADLFHQRTALPPRQPQMYTVDGPATNVRGHRRAGVSNGATT